MQAWVATVLAVAALVAVMAFAAVRAIKNETISALRENNEAAKETNERLGAEKDDTAKALAASQAEVATLREQLRHTPRYEDVVRLQREGLEHLDREAHKRQEEFVAMVVAQQEQHNLMVAEHYRKAAEADRRHEQVNRQILSALGSLTESLEGGLTINEKP